MKKWLISLLLILGRIMVFFSLNNPEKNVEDKPILTREQQDNVVKWIVRGYEPIHQIEFLQFNKDKKTGSYYLLFRLNNEDKYKTGLSIQEIQEFNDGNGSVGLSPIDAFLPLSRQKTINSEQNIDISEIRIIYLEDNK